MNESELSRANDITIKEVKSLPLFTHFSDEQAIEVFKTVKRFGKIVYTDYLKNKMKEE